MTLLQKHVGPVSSWQERKSIPGEATLQDSVRFLRKLHAGQKKVGERLEAEKNTGFLIQLRPDL